MREGEDGGGQMEDTEHPHLVIIRTLAPQEQPIGHIHHK